MRYLVTGGCGFIGSHLTAHLVEQGHQAVVIDDLSTGSIANLPQQAEFIRGDVRDQTLLQQVLRGVDGVVHLAAIASVERSTRDWVECHAVNISTFVVLLEAVARSDRPQIPIVYASSAAVYGDSGTLPLQETEPPRPLSAYGADKLACEQHARVAAHVFSMRTVGLRFFNVYGPRQDPASSYSGVISVFARRIIAGERLTIFGDGAQSRDFIYVADVVAAIDAALHRADAEARVLNVCTGSATTIRDLADRLATITGRPAEIGLAEPRQGDIRHSLGDPRRMNAFLATAAATPLDHGLRATLDWMAETSAVAQPDLTGGS